jgi:Xaa-Pro aminopeptidase
MQDYLRKQVDWPQAFPAEEYAERRRKVRAALSAKGLDAIYVTTPANLTYLTGYDMIWYHSRNLTGLLIRADSDQTVWFDAVGHTTLVLTTPTITDIVWFQREPVDSLIRQIGRELRHRGLGKARIALEPWGYSPHGKVMEALGAALREGGADVQDESLLIERIRLVKSPLEISVIREAAAMADRAMAAARDAIAPGVMETEIEAVIMHSMMREGGGYPGIRTMIGSGPRAGTHHSPPSHRKIKQGDLVFVDFCSSLYRYHVNLNRTFSLGEPDQRWKDLMWNSAGCIEAIVAGIRTGDPWSKVAKLGDRYLEERGLKKYVWWAGGYALGIAVPPDWVGSFFAEPREDVADQPLQPGMVFNYENQFDVWEGWPGGSGAAYIETLLVTSSGPEILSALPRVLVVV